MYLFNDPAYPIIHDDSRLADALKRPEVRIAIYRNPYMPNIIRDFAKAIRSRDVPELANTYDVFGVPGKTSAGRTLRTEPFTPELLASTSDAAGIDIDHNALPLLTHHVNKMGIVYEKAYRGYTGDQTHKVVCNELFTPKGGRGRSPVHADNLILSGHWAFALAPIDLMTTEPTDRLWHLLNRSWRDTLPIEERECIERQMDEYGRTHQDEFAASCIGDFLLVKGQKGKDLDNLEARKGVSVHKSSNQITELGQSTVLYFHRDPARC